MNIRALIAAIVLLAPPAAAQQLRPTKEDVKEAITADSSVSYPESDIETFRRKLHRALARKKLEDAADEIAGEYDLPAAATRQLVRAWVIGEARRYAFDEEWTPAVRSVLRSIVPDLRGTPLGLAALTQAFDATTEDCSAEDFRTLMAGSNDPAADAYVIASNTSCSGNFTRAASMAGDRAMPALIRAAHYGGMAPRDALPLYAWLTKQTTLIRVREADRPAVATILWQRYLSALFDAHLDEVALALFDALPAELRTDVVSPLPRQTTTAVIDGISMTFEADHRTTVLDGQDLAAAADALEAMADRAAGAVEKPVATQPETPSRNLGSIDAPILRLAEAMAISGRSDEARRLLATLPGLAEAKLALACVYAMTEKTKAKCADTSRLPMGALPVDHFLNSPDADPYPIAETTLAGTTFSERSASNAVLCRVFPKERYADLCRDGIDNNYFSETSSVLDEDPEASATLERIISDFGQLRSALLGIHDVPPEKPRDRRRSGTTVVAIPPDFSQKPIPMEFAGRTAPPQPKGLAPLPDGFHLVRAERKDRRAVAVSVSQTYDPTGEISRGGYWVHVSEDGGKHWAPPLYTGLADRFPYVVQQTSPLPLIAGNMVQLAVDIAEIDTASISYPPVGLRTRRQASDRYLTLPLDELRRDRDGDGITDIAAHHLLLDGTQSPPFVVGSDYDADCRAAPSSEKLAMIDLLGRFAGASDAAIIEPVNRPPGQLVGNWSRTSASVDQPIFLIGRGRDYACLASKRLIIVYDSANIEAMKRYSPDFRALEMPSIIFNRAGDRGYVRWSMGWTGGTYRLRLINGRWTFDSISSWIT